MNKLAIITGLALAAGAATAGQPIEVLLNVDLSVENEVTISATSGLAAADASFSNFTGFMLADFFASALTDTIGEEGAGDFSTFANPSDGSPRFFAGSGNVGLNFWSFSTDSTLAVTSGQQAFAGSATFSVAAADYAAMLAGAVSGDVYANADTDDDIGAGAILIGAYRVIPTPGSFALLGLGGLAAARRRR